MKADFRRIAWPITLKAPLLVAALMIVVGSLLSREVLVRLRETQEEHLQALSRAYLDGVSSAILPYVLREDVWEVFDALDRARSRYQGLDGLSAVVANAEGRVIAASDPKRFPTNTYLQSQYRSHQGHRERFEINIEQKRAAVIRPLAVQQRSVGLIYAEFDITNILNERRAVFWQLLATNAGLTFALAGIGYLVVRRILQPVELLNAYLTQARDGPLKVIPDSKLSRPDSETGQLLRQYNAMASAANEREALILRLAEEERLASIGRLAAGTAHEINNPLGGMFNALDTLKRYPDRNDVRETSLRLIETGLVGIRHVVRTMLYNYQDTKQARPLVFADIEDLRFLIHSQIAVKRLTLAWENRLSEPFPIDANPVRQATLNLLLNACAAAPDASAVRLKAEANGTTFQLSIGNDGKPIPPEYISYLEGGHKGHSALLNGKGLGLWMVRRIADQTDGNIIVNCPETGGTEIHISFPAAKTGLPHAG